MRTKTSIIATVSQNSVIRRGVNDPLWPRLRKDLQRFRRCTRGHVVIVGRRTYEVLLRLNDQLLKECGVIVVTRNQDYRAEGCVTAVSLEKARDLALGLAQERRNPRVFIIGGEEILWQAMSWADWITITLVNDYIGDGNAHFPPFPPPPKDAWEQVKVEPHEPDKDDPSSYVLYEYRRKGVS